MAADPPDVDGYASGGLSFQINDPSVQWNILDQLEHYVASCVNMIKRLPIEPETLGAREDRDLLPKLLA